jgi:hypothetical protein
MPMRFRSIRTRAKNNFRRGTICWPRKGAVKPKHQAVYGSIGIKFPSQSFAAILQRQPRLEDNKTCTGWAVVGSLNVPQHSKRSYGDGRTVDCGHNLPLCHHDITGE